MKYLVGLLLVFIIKAQSIAQICMPIPGSSYTVTTNGDFNMTDLRQIINQANTFGQPCNIYFNVPAGNTINLSMSTLPDINVQVYIDGTNMATGQPMTINGQNMIAGPALNLKVANSCYKNLNFINFLPVNAVVTNTNDSGTGSLRDAITKVNGAGSGSVYFNITGTPPHKIVCLSELPIIKAPITIDGTTQPANGYTGASPKIELDGTSLSTNSTGLNMIAAKNCGIYGLYIHNFGTGIKSTYRDNSASPARFGGNNIRIGDASRRNVISANGIGVYLEGVKDGAIENNYIGTNVTGDVASGNGNGIYLYGDTNTVVKNNLLSGNNSDGLFYSDSKNLKIVKNKIGTTTSGTVVLGNKNNGIEGLGGTVLIGGSASTDGNVISGNGTAASYKAGIFLSGGFYSPGSVKILGNKIGVDINGTTVIANLNGILNNGGLKSLYIGSSNSNERNIISGNIQAGAFIKGVSDSVVVKGNYIGLDVSGSIDLGNGDEGFVVHGDAKVILVGGSNAGERNIISGNGDVGIYGDLKNTNDNVKYEIVNNIVGLNAAGNTAIPNQHGISLHYQLKNVLVSGNVVSGNIGVGVSLAGESHQVLNNKIGTDVGGTIALGNGTTGVSVSGINHKIGGSGVNDPNIIANNGQNAILLSDATTKGVLITQNSIYNNGGKGINQGLISTSKGNDSYPKPIINWATPSICEGTAPANSKIEIYQNHTANANTQGKTYLASVITDASGNWSYSSSFPNPYDLTAIAIDPITNNTSEFSDKYIFTQWTGAVSGDWNNAANWTNGVPDCSKHTVIPDVTNDPILNAGNNGLSYDVLILTNGKLSIANTYTLTVCKGNLGNYGNTNLGNGTIEFASNQLQKIFNGGQVGSLKVNNTGDGILFQASTTLILTESLSLVDGIVTTGTGNFIYLNNSTASNLIAYSSNSFINGTLKRDIAANSDTYVFPLGKGVLATDYFRLDFINNNIVGVTTLIGTVAGITETGNNVDSRLNVNELASPYSDIKEVAEWDITNVGSVTSGSYGIRLYTENISGLTDNAFAVLKRNSSSTDYADWSNFAGTTIPSSGTSGRTVVSGYAERLGFTSFSKFAVASAPITLGVVWVSFSIANDDNGVALNWETSSENDNKGFSVQRSSDGKSFEEISFVNASGLETGGQYSFVDENPLIGTNYYRLEQIDFDGSYTISNILTIENKVTSLIQVVDADKLTLGWKLSNASNAQIYNVSGSKIYEQSMNVGENIISTISLDPGFYILVLSSEEGVYRGTFVK